MRTRRLIISGVALLAVVAGGTACNNSSDGGSTPTTAAQHTPSTTGRQDLHLQAVLGQAQATEIQRVLHATNQTAQGQWSSMPEFLQYVVDDAQNVWNWYYQQWGLNITSEVTGREPRTVPTACSGGDADDSAFFYCSTDDTIYISLARAARKWNGTDRYDGQPASAATSPPPWRWPTSTATTSRAS
jgi:predicted metalloprotease